MMKKEEEEEFCRVAKKVAGRSGKSRCRWKQIRRTKARKTTENAWVVVVVVVAVEGRRKPRALLSAARNADSPVSVVVVGFVDGGGDCKMMLASDHARIFCWESLGLGNGGLASLVEGVLDRYLTRRSSWEVGVGGETDRRPRGNDVDPSMTVEGLTRG